ncbi:MAG: RusA family crossover junction endodeoxyribonuclease [Treponema sp.]|nr:RusA family crossover junction endodeoxyribonuclease [Treponema sp.]
MLDIFVEGIPKAQPRHRTTKTGHIYTPNTAKEWKDAIAMTIYEQGYGSLVLDEPVKLFACFYFPMPKKYGKRFKEGLPHIVKPDSDNLLKAVMDCMTQARVWRDDSIVFDSRATKWYTHGATGARIKAEVWEGSG